MLRVYEAGRRIFFHNFMNGMGIQKIRRAEWRGPKNKATNQRGTKIKHEWKGVLKFSALHSISGLSFKRAS